MAESIELIKAAWTREEVTFEGKYWSTKDLPVLPKPVQEPHPPVLLAANNNDTFAYAGRLGLGVIGTMFSQPLPRMADRLAEFESAKPRVQPVHPAERARHGLVLRRPHSKGGSPAHQGELEGRRSRSGPRAHAAPGDRPHTPRLRHRRRGWMTWDFARATEVCIYDEPSACVERLQILKEQLPTLDHCILEFNRRGRISSDKVRESMKLFAEKVMPQL